jgi:hypothetical protein
LCSRLKIDGELTETRIIRNALPLTHPHPSECSSYVGMVGGKQYVTISPGCQYDQGALMHELGHVLGTVAGVQCVYCRSFSLFKISPPTNMISSDIRVKIC